MPAKVSIEEIKKRLDVKHKGMISIKDENSIVNMHSRITFIDCEYGEWDAPVYSVVNEGHLHPLRGKVKQKNTMLKKYGVENPLDKSLRKTTFSIEKVKSKIKNVFGDELYLDESTYKNTYTKCRFVHKKYGEWWVIPKQLWIYGYKGPQKLVNQEETHRKKVLMGQLNKSIKKHWKTNEELICQAGWEPKVVDYLNDNQIDFKWQIPFKMPNKKLYVVDLYLVDENKWVEIKGYFRKDAKEKWDWFHEEYTNSELWDKKKLKELSIL